MNPLLAPAQAGAPGGEERRRLSPAGVPAFAGTTESSQSAAKSAKDSREGLPGTSVGL
jgi:hypothetical protein